MDNHGGERVWFHARRMKKALFWILPILLLAAGGFAYYRYASGPKTAVLDYKTAALEKKRIVGKITASGTLQAVVTVQVGAQVSGRIQFLYADFNSTVKKGEVVAKIEPQLFQAAVAQANANFRVARANVAQNEAKLLDADRQYKRAKDLKDQGLATQVEVDTAQTTAAVAKALLDSSRAEVDQARAQLNQATVNLSYTTIVSPIDGVVISRSVDVGQTVASSLQAPVIFTIAENLKKMQVNTSVSEGDVGRLDTGMPSSFTVDAFPGQRFKGTIAQIRNAAQTVQNVVTYNAMIDVSNDDLKLRPGMTANVTVIYAQKDDVLAVPNGALRFRPPPEMPGAAPAASASSSGGPPGSGTGRRGGGGPGGGKRDGNDGGSRSVWVLRDGQPVSVTIQTGLTDGTNTELVSGDLHEGDLLIIDATVKSGSAPASTAAAAPAGPAGGAGAPRRLF